jgi:hypothetical protein
MQDFEDLMPARSRGSQFQKRLQAFALWAMYYKKIHAGGMHWIMKPLHKPGSNKRIQSLGDQLRVVSHKGGDLFVRQQCAGMSMQENQQIKVTAVPDHRSTSEQPLNLLRIVTVVGECRNNFLRSRFVDWSANWPIGIISG